MCMDSATKLRMRCRRVKSWKDQSIQRSWDGNGKNNGNTNGQGKICEKLRRKEQASTIKMNLTLMTAIKEGNITFRPRQ